MTTVTTIAIFTLAALGGFHAGVAFLTLRHMVLFESEFFPWLAVSGIALNGTLMLLELDNPARVVVDAIFVIVWVAALVRWWWRRRGRKLAEKALGAVRDIGYRLTVVPVPVPEGTG